MKRYLLKFTKNTLQLNSANFDPILPNITLFLAAYYPPALSERTPKKKTQPESVSEGITPSESVLPASPSWTSARTHPRAPRRLYPRDKELAQPPLGRISPSRLPRGSFYFRRLLRLRRRIPPRDPSLPRDLSRNRVLASFSFCFFLRSGARHNGETDSPAALRKTVSPA